jgi:3-oxoacyl-[acyl-carrier-protein] synthase III
LQAAGLSSEDLDFIITATNTPDMSFPCTGCFIQGKIGAKKAAAFDVSAGCTSFIHALSLADKFIKEDPSRKIMVLGAEIMSKVTDWTDRATCVLFGDGAGAVILVGEEGDRGARRREGPPRPGRGDRPLLPEGDKGIKYGKCGMRRISRPLCHGHRLKKWSNLLLPGHFLQHLDDGFLHGLRDLSLVDEYITDTPSTRSIGQIDDPGSPGP